MAELPTEVVWVRSRTYRKDGTRTLHVRDRNRLHGVACNRRGVYVEPVRGSGDAGYVCTLCAGVAVQIEAGRGGDDG